VGGGVNAGSLFSGIGGLELGLERAGMTIRWQSEIDPYCCRVLAKHWPHVPNLGDVKTIDWKAVEPVDLICGGYPCQPFSLAGVRRGESDPRHLWPWFRDALRVLRPRFALLENVPGHLGLGFDAVLGDLASLGYDTEWDCIPAAAVGAPHLRYRVFVVAYAAGDTRRVGNGNGAADDAYANGEGEPGESVDAVTRPRLMVPDARSDQLREQPVAVTGCSGATVARDDGPDGHVADAFGSRLEVLEREPGDDGGQRPAAERDGDRRGWWAVEPDVDRVAHGVPHRVERLRALGNAVVPQVAQWLGERIMEMAA
jgi:DNA (cytosine-5)-methyltransferase 1